MLSFSVSTLMKTNVSLFSYVYDHLVETLMLDNSHYRIRILPDFFCYSVLSWYLTQKERASMYTRVGVGWNYNFPYPWPEKFLAESMTVFVSRWWCCTCHKYWEVVFLFIQTSETPVILFSWETMRWYMMGGRCLQLPNVGATLCSSCDLKVMVLI